MSFLRQRGGRGGPAEDDVEANAGATENGNDPGDSAMVTGSSSAAVSPGTEEPSRPHAHDDSHISFPGKLPVPVGHQHHDGGEELGEYEALDRFITNFDAERRASMVSSGGRSRKAKRWWQFWKSSAEPDEEHPVKDEGKAPDHWLNTDIQQGVSSSQVEERRRRFGWNELQAEKQDLLRQLFGYFQGPILYGMSSRRHKSAAGLIIDTFPSSYGAGRATGCGLGRLG